MFYGFDPIYLIIMGVGMALSLGASAWVRIAVNKYSKVPIGRGMTGRAVAQAILDVEGIRDVKIEMTPSRLGDHYDPRTKTLRLSPDHYDGRSIAAAGIAAHEVGHAIQHKDGYAPMRLRQTMVPVANIGTNLGVILVMIGAAIGMLGLAQIGVFIFAGFVAFQLVTLPVELDASARAKRALLSTGLVSQEEAVGVSRVLTAAAATYLAAAITALLQLAYFAMRAGLLGGRSRDD